MNGYDVHFLFGVLCAVESEGLWLVHHALGETKYLVNGLQAYAGTESIGICDWVIVATKLLLILSLMILRLLLVNIRIYLAKRHGNVENLAHAFGGDRTIIAGLCFTCINRTAPHMIESPFPGYVQFGEFGRSIRQEGMKMVHAFESSGKVRGLQNPRTKPSGESSAGMYLQCTALLRVGESRI